MKRVHKGAKEKWHFLTYVFNGFFFQFLRLKRYSFLYFSTNWWKVKEPAKRSWPLESTETISLMFLKLRLWIFSRSGSVKCPGRPRNHEVPPPYSFDPLLHLWFHSVNENSVVFDQAGKLVHSKFGQYRILGRTSRPEASYQPTSSLNFERYRTDIIACPEAEFFPTNENTFQKFPWKS